MARKNTQATDADVTSSDDTKLVAAESTEATTIAPKPETAPKTEAKPRSRTPAKKPSAPAESTIYIGPTLPGGKLFHSTAFRGGKLPGHVEKLVEECPALKFLFVPPARLAVARAQLSDKASVVAAKSAEVRKHFYKGAS